MASGYAPGDPPTRPSLVEHQIVIHSYAWLSVRLSTNPDRVYHPVVATYHPFPGDGAAPHTVPVVGDHNSANRLAHEATLPLELGASPQRFMAPGFVVWCPDGVVTVWAKPEVTVTVKLVSLTVEVLDDLDDEFGHLVGSSLLRRLPTYQQVEGCTHSPNHPDWSTAVFDPEARLPEEDPDAEH